MVHSVLSAKNYNLKLFLKRETFYVSLSGRIFFKQKILYRRGLFSSKSTAKVYFLLYVFLVLERFGLLTRFF